jgi:Xaa-Pro aminopeptidase
VPDGGKVGFDPWLHTKGEIGTVEMALRDSGIQLVAGENLVDRMWQDRPAPPDAKIVDYPIEFAGKSSTDKRTDIAGVLRESEHSAAILTQPESIAWLLNIRGADLPRVPVALAFAILFADGKVSLFTDPDKVSNRPADPDIDVHDWSDFPASLARLEDDVRVDKTTAPLAVSTLLNEADVKIVYASDPCMLPKACKNAVEIAGSRAAHLRDGAAMVEFLCWLDRAAPAGGLSEIDVVKQLDECVAGCQL